MIYPRLQSFKVLHKVSSPHLLTLSPPLTMTREPLDTDSSRGSKFSVLRECPAPVSSNRTCGAPNAARRKQQVVTGQLV